MSVSLRKDYRYIKKGSKTVKEFKGYLADFYEGGPQPRRKRVSLGTRNERAAIQKVAELDRMYMAGLFDPWTMPLHKEGVLLKEAVRRFTSHLQREGRKEKTVATYASILGLLEKSLYPAALVGDVSPRDVASFLDGRDINATSRATYLRHLRAFFRWCEREGLVNSVPIPKASQPRPKRRMKPFLTRSEYDHLLAVVDADAEAKGAFLRPGQIRWVTDVVRFATHTGLRLGEVCNVRWAGVDLESQFITVQTTDTFESKSGHERSVYLVGDALDVVERLADARDRRGDADPAGYVFTGAEGGRLSGEYVSKRFRFYRRKAGLSKAYHFHTLRHTFASWWVMGGGDLYRLKEVLGHASIEQTMTYAHLRPEAQKDDMERIFGATPSSTPP